MTDLDDPRLADLDPYERAELLVAMEHTYGGESLGEFIGREFPEEPLPKHGGVLAEVLSEARRRPIRVCLSWPPGHAKTTILSRGVAWWLKKFPADTCAYTTYSDARAYSKSRLIRAYARMAGVPLDPQASGVAEWRTLQNGGLIAAGARGGITGVRIPGLYLVDDPYKNRDEVRSEKIREAVWERFREVAFTRLQGGSIIVLHTRWDEDDLIGRIVRTLGWDVINQPAIAEVDDGVRKVGDALWPDRYPVEVCAHECGHDGHLAEIRHNLQEYSFGALYQGRPAPEGGNRFKRLSWRWFRFAAEEHLAGMRPHDTWHEPVRPEQIVGQRPGARPGILDFDEVVVSVDATFGTETDDASDVAVLTFGTRGATACLADAYAEKASLEATIAEAKRQIGLWRATQCLVELKANGRSVIVALERALADGEIRDAAGRPVICEVIPVEPQGGKLARAHGVQHMVSAGLVLLREGAPWLEKFIAQAAAFPNATLDDMVDAMTQFLAWWQEKNGMWSTLNIPMGTLPPGMSGIVQNILRRAR